MSKKTRNFKKRFSPEERYKYHNSRDRNPSKYGIKRGGAKNCYSAGFADAFAKVNNVKSVRNEFGAVSAGAYSLGLKRGNAAAKAYEKKTGKSSIYVV